MPEFKQLVTLSPFDLDATGDWLFWAEAPNEAFRQSIAELGQLDPVLAVVDGEEQRLVAGYKRLLACRELGENVTARFLDNPDPVTCGRIYAASNRQRQPDAADLVRAGRFFANYADDSHLDRQLAEISGPEGGRRTPELVRTWLRLDRSWDEALRAGHVPLRAAEVLTRLGDVDIDELWPFFRDLRWSRNNALQFLTRLEEAAFRGRLSVAELIRSSGLRDILEADLSPKDRIHRLVHRARELRYPRLARLEAEFADLAREASRSGMWHISPAGSFESDRLHLSASVAGPEDLVRAGRELERLQREGVLERIGEWQRSRLSGSAEEK